MAICSPVAACWPRVWILSSMVMTAHLFNNLTRRPCSNVIPMTNAANWMKRDPVAFHILNFVEFHLHINKAHCRRNKFHQREWIGKPIEVFNNGFWRIPDSRHSDPIALEPARRRSGDLSQRCVAMDQSQMLTPERAIHLSLTAINAPLNSTISYRFIP